MNGIQGLWTLIFNTWKLGCEGTLFCLYFVLVTPYVFQLWIRVSFIISTNCHIFLNSVIGMMHVNQIMLTVIFRSQNANATLMGTTVAHFTHSWSWALLEKLPIMQQLKNFPVFYGPRKFITAFTRALHWSLSWARSIQSIPSHPISLRSILILSTHLLLGLRQYLC
jgi:hypothetical protein